MVNWWEVYDAAFMEIFHQYAKREENRNVRKNDSKHSVEQHQTILLKVARYAATGDLQVFGAFEEHRAKEKTFHQEPVWPGKSLHFRKQMENPARFILLQISRTVCGLLSIKSYLFTHFVLTSRRWQQVWFNTWEQDPENSKCSDTMKSCEGLTGIVDFAARKWKRKQFACLIWLTESNFFRFLCMENTIRRSYVYSYCVFSLVFLKFNKTDVIAALGGDCQVVGVIAHCEVFDFFLTRLIMSIWTVICRTKSQGWKVRGLNEDLWTLITGICHASRKQSDEPLTGQ